MGQRGLYAGSGSRRKLPMTIFIVGCAFVCMAFLTALPNASAAPLFTQCPAVGQNTGCAILITVNSNGTTSVQSDPNPPNDGPYDGSDDTLVGLQNNSGSAVGSINLSSTSAPIFGFDGDGICDPSTWVTPGNGAAPGCPSASGFGPTGYEGPNNTFSNISPDTMSGTVNFTAGVPPGGSAYWALEDTLSAADVTPGTVSPPSTVGQNPYNPYSPYGTGKCDGVTTTINGTSKSDTVVGTVNRDVISTGAGNDIVRALGGNDLICTGSGNDIVFGGQGNDKIFGGSGQDRLLGSPGNDKLIGGGGNDNMFGGAGNDKLFGKGGSDKLFGGPGNDDLFGGPGKDTLVCGVGADFGVGGPGHDVAKSCRLHAIG